jgi:hypothetical protein
VATAAALLGATRQVSPELALVDAALAEELRASLDVPLATNEPAVVTIAPMPTEPSSGGDVSDLIVGAVDDKADERETTYGYSAAPEVLPADNQWRAAAAPAVDHEDAPDLIVAASVLAGEETGATSGYPSLPAPRGATRDPMEAAEAALREIRTRLGGEASEKPRSALRTRLAVALGATTLLAFAVLVADLYYGIAPLAS